MRFLPLALVLLTSLALAGTPTQTSSVTVFNGETSRSVSLTSVTGGASLVVMIATENDAGDGDPGWSASDGTNTYTNNLYIETVNSRTVGTFYRHNVSAGSVTVTVTRTSSNAYGRMVLLELPGLANSSPGTKGTNSDHPNDGGTHAVTSGSTGMLAQADNMILAVLLGGVDPGPGAFTHPPTGYTSIASYTGTAGADPAVSFVWKDVSATTAINTDWGTLATSYYWSATAIPLPKATAIIVPQVVHHLLQQFSYLPAANGDVFKTRIAK